MSAAPGGYPATSLAGAIGRKVVALFGALEADLDGDRENARRLWAEARAAGETERAFLARREADEERERAASVNRARDYIEDRTGSGVSSHVDLHEAVARAERQRAAAGDTDADRGA